MENDKDKDAVEILLNELKENTDVVLAFIPLVRRLKEAGILNLIAEITKDYLPTDVEFLGHFFTSREFTYAALKSANLLVSVMYALADEQVSDMLKLIMFNLRGVADAFLEQDPDHKSLSLLKMSKMMKDPDTSRGIKAMFGVLKALGETLNRTN
ncbi:MAG: DUF1641 domain-containing protein [Candidatus Thermoplasmatota archaeon]|jgi:uncharacterized protein YjgD (DUF1641 family)|nr:DUF1641 domain-containing protein [Candidatus Thermoplasmatota archaeon]MCL5785590.1 DUF1641 domain-containing protein [Candidatus Thermoplasmatota archaeon]